MARYSFNGPGSDARLAAWEDARNEPPECDDEDLTYGYDAHIAVFRNGKMVSHRIDKLGENEGAGASSIAKSFWLDTPKGQAWHASGAKELPVKERHYFTELKDGWQFERAQCGGVKVTVRYEPVERERDPYEGFHPSDAQLEAMGYYNY